MGESLSPDQFMSRYGGGSSDPQAAAPISTDDSDAPPAPGTQPYYDNFTPKPLPPTPGRRVVPDMTYGYTPSEALKNPNNHVAPSTKTMIDYDLILNGGKGLPSILRQDPSMISKSAYATAATKSAQNLSNLRDALGSYEGIIDQFGDVGAKAGPDVLPLAIGSDYTDREHPPTPDNSWLPSVSGMVNGIAKTYAAATAPPGKGLGVLNGADTSSNAYVANNARLYGSGDPINNPNDYDRALATNTRLQHLKNAIAMVYKTLPVGSQGSATDQAQQIVTNMIGEAMKAPDNDTFFKIIGDAKSAIGALKRDHTDSHASNATVPNTLDWRPGNGAQLAQQAMQGRTSFLGNGPPPQQLTHLSYNPQTGHKIGWNGSAWVDAP